jgi:hypothetical protein
MVMTGSVVTSQISMGCKVQKNATKLSRNSLQHVQKCGKIDYAVTDATTVNVGCFCDHRKGLISQIYYAVCNNLKSFND